MDTTTRRTPLLIALFLGFILAAGCLLAGCSSEKDQVKQAIDNSFAINDETISQVADKLDDNDIKTLELMGIDAHDLFTKLADGYSYQVGDITLNGTQATAEVTVTTHDLSPVLEDYKTKVMDYASSLSAEPEVDAVYQQLGQYLNESLEGLSSSTATTTETLKVDLVKEGNTWSLAHPDQVRKQLSKVLFGKLSEAGFGD